MPSPLDTGSADPLFDNLPADPYIQGLSRRRRFSRFTATPGNLQRLKHNDSAQSSRVSPLAGGARLPDSSSGH